MRNYGEGDPHSARRHRAPQDYNTISVAEVREKMIDHVYDIVELNERENRENQRPQHIFNAQVCNNRGICEKFITKMCVCVFKGKF